MTTTKSKSDFACWKPCNIYPTAIIGKGCSIGMFSEIGDHVVIGSDTRIGAHSFIPCGVVIGDDVFIGPHVCFTNDRYPPSDRSQWENTIVHHGAAIGAGCCILCGITIGANATIGAGSVVTRDVPANEVWAGNPARRLRAKDGNWKRHHRAFTLLELLASITIIVILMAMLLPVIVRATHWCYEWAYGATTWKNDQIRAYVNDDSTQETLDFYATNGVHRWKSYDGVRLWPADAYVP